jgi:phosphoglycolate phosphatase-like HAD superfamily hydrolase
LSKSTKLFTGREVDEMQSDEIRKITGSYLVATDADGVIWNTVDECFYVAYPIFQKIEGNISNETDRLQTKFREGRFLAKNGEDFFIILKLIKDNPDVDFYKVTLDNLNELREILKDRLEGFAQSFYQERKKLQTENPDAWLSLQTSYPGVPEQLSLLKADFLDLVICTTKDSDSINLLLKKEGQSYPVLGRDFSTHKPDQMKKLRESYSITSDRILFIDDLLENLLPVKEEGVHVFMAKWGYNNRKEQKKAEKLGIPLLDINNIHSQLSDYCVRISGKN